MRGWGGRGLAAALLASLAVVPSGSRATDVRTGEAAARFRPWDRILEGARRFKPALDGGAVLDRETGLVWEKAPDTSTVPWVNAPFVCYAKSVAGRKGWRLPAAEELASLIDPNAIGPALPAGNPFAGVQPEEYWSATSIAGVFGEAYAVSMADGSMVDEAKSAPLHYWCVRGGLGYDGM